MYKVGEIIEAEVTGIESYGIFVKVDKEYNGLIHISEIDNNYIKDINKYVKLGDNIYTNVIGIDDATKHLKLSIRNMNYNDNNHGKRIIKENIKGFLPLYNKLDEWIEETLHELRK
mgnify:CR=1 FL=1